MHNRFLHFFAWRYYLSHHRGGRGAQFLGYSLFAVVFSVLVCNGIYEAYLGGDYFHLFGVSVIGIFIVLYTCGILIEFRRICRSANSFAHGALLVCHTKPEVIAYFAELYPGFNV